MLKAKRFVPVAVALIFIFVQATSAPAQQPNPTSAVATVDAGGVVTGIGPGTATIKATAEGASSTTALTVVKSNLRSLAIEPRSTSARAGDVVHFTAKGTPSSDFTPQWSASGSGATIYSDGAFVAEQPGTYIVSAGSGNVTTTASVVV